MSAAILLPDPALGRFILGRGGLTRGMTKSSTVADRSSNCAIIGFAALTVATSIVIVMIPDVLLRLAIVAGVGVLLAIVILGVEVMAFAFLCAAFMIGSFDSLRVLPFMTYGDVALIISIGLGALASGWAFRRIWLPITYVAGGVILVLAGLISSFLASDLESLANLALLVFAALTLPVLGALWRPTMAQVQLLALFYVVGQSVGVVYALVTPLNVTTGRAVGLALRPNHFGLAAAFGLCLSVFLFLSWNGRNRWFAVATGSACGVGVFLSGSRAALLGVLAMVIAVALITRAWKISALAIAAIAAAVLAQDALLSSVPQGSALYRLLGDNATTVENAGRLQSFTSSFDSFRANPYLGRGFANSLEAHNILLQVATAAGIIGLIGFVLILYTAVRPLVRTDLGVARWLALPPLVYIVAGLVSNVLWDRSIWALLGLSVLVLIPDTGWAPPTINGAPRLASRQTAPAPALVRLMSPPTTTLRREGAG